MFQLTKPSVKLWAHVCARVAAVGFSIPLLKPLNEKNNDTTFPKCSLNSLKKKKKSLSFCSSQTSNVFDAEVSVNYQVITMVCKFPPEWGRRGWRGLGRDWIRMATHVAQLLLKGLFITVMSHLASGPLLSPSSILTRPHLNNGPDAQTVLHFVFVRMCVGGGVGWGLSFKYL